MFSGRSGSSATSNMPASQAVPVAVLSSRSALAKGPSSGSAYGARSEPGSPKSRANASGSTIRSVPSAWCGELVEGRAVVGRVEPGRALHEAHAEPVRSVGSRDRSAMPPRLPVDLARRPRRRQVPDCGAWADQGRPSSGASCSPAAAPSASQGADKASIEIAGVTLLEHVLGALRRSRRRRRRRRGDHEPSGHVRAGGPAGGWPGAGSAGRAVRRSPPPAPVVVLAVDMPLVTTATVSRLLLSAGGRRCRCSSTTAGGGSTSARSTAARRSREAAPPLEEQHGLPMRRLVSGLRLAEVPALAWEARDVDTWAGPDRAAGAAGRLIAATR